VIIRRYWRARFMVVRCWLAFFRLVHMFGWKFAVARVKLTGVGFKFWSNVKVSDRPS
jgi:hypothetical protein